MTETEATPQQLERECEKLYAMIRMKTRHRDQLTEELDLLHGKADILERKWAALTQAEKG
jgi:hypothetical protein